MAPPPSVAFYDPRVHVGLGESTNVMEVRVRWPTGEEESFGDFSADQTVVLTYGKGIGGIRPRAEEPPVEN